MGIKLIIDTDDELKKAKDDKLNALIQEEEEKKQQEEEIKLEEEENKNVWGGNQEETEFQRNMEEEGFYVQEEEDIYRPEDDPGFRRATDMDGPYSEAGILSEANDPFLDPSVQDYLYEEQAGYEDYDRPEQEGNWDNEASQINVYDAFGSGGEGY